MGTEAIMTGCSS